jgi:hypothetical protein
MLVFAYTATFANELHQNLNFKSTPAPRARENKYGDKCCLGIVLILSADTNPVLFHVPGYGLNLRLIQERGCT